MLSIHDVEHYEQGGSYFDIRSGCAGKSDPCIRRFPDAAAFGQADDGKA